MKLFSRFKHAYGHFSRDEPGKRFMNLHERWRERAKAPLVFVAGLLVGMVFVGAGFLLGFVPGVPGIALGIVGLAIIAAFFRPLAVNLDRFESWVRKRFRRKHRRDR